tara:strand:- start:292 stop:813 length:522 start_codon:yes stop_codon:yes gene_type:complete
MQNFAETGQKIKALFLNKKFLVIIFVVALFLGVALYVYNNYIAPRINPDFVPNREFDTGSGDGADTSGKVAEIYFFSVEWCNHSKLAKPEWDLVKKDLHGTKPENSHYTINFIELDGDNDESQIDTFESEYLTPNGKKIDGYPSIWMVKGTDVYEFAAKPTYNSIKEFIEALV